MAGSRLDKIGTLFSRATGLLRSGVIKYQDRPLWYDVYRVFPPKYEPYIEREPEKTLEIPEIFYKEDKHRADFFQRFGANPQGEVRRLGDLSTEETSHKFIKKCEEVAKSNPVLSYDEVFNTVAEEYGLNRPSKSSTRDQKKQGSYFEHGQYEDQIKSGSPAIDSDERVIVSGSNQEKRTPIVTKEALRALFTEFKEENESDKKLQDKNKDKS